MIRNMGVGRNSEGTLNPESIMRKPNQFIRLCQRMGLVNRRNLFWSWYQPYNFGDWVGPYLFEKITGKRPLYISRDIPLPATAFFSAGSIMRKITSPDTAIVWGSGIISKGDEFARPLSIYAVRGPYTRERCIELGYKCPQVYGDPALLLPLFLKKQNTSTDFDIGIIPHFVDLHLFDGSVDSRTTVIDVTQPLPAVIRQIVRCKRTISSSLHGIITSHAYGIPSAWVTMSDGLDGDGVKFLDHLASLEIGDVSVPTPFVPNEMPDTEDLYFTTPPARIVSERQLALLANCPFRASR